MAKYKFFVILLKQLYLNIVYFVYNNAILSILRTFILNKFHPNFNISKGVRLRKNITFYGGSYLDGYLEIGTGTFINEECFLDYSSDIVIGQNVALGMRVIVLTSSHKIGFTSRCGETLKKKTVIEDNCWIGAGAIIYPGVTIKKGSVIAAGEVVIKDIEENKLYKNKKSIDIIFNEGKS